ncbi:MAG TPA: hypothetical protein PLZ29_04810 [Spirochaetota bacterium]|nr:hypothetical protein [Spirochaetota bacterium]HQQ50496.1 hypothetical protein [Spirochaetota bacterium]
MTSENYFHPLLVATCQALSTRAIVFASLYDFVFYIVKAIDLCRDHFLVENITRYSIFAI